MIVVLHGMAFARIQNKPKRRLKCVGDPWPNVDIESLLGGALLVREGSRTLWWRAGRVGEDQARRSVACQSCTLQHLPELSSGSLEQYRPWQKTSGHNMHRAKV